METEVRKLNYAEDVTLNAALSRSLRYLRTVLAEAESVGNMGAVNTLSQEVVRLQDLSTLIANCDAIIIRTHDPKGE